MQFNSIDFMLFFPIVLLVYFVIPKKIRMYWLLLASYYFYMCWNAKYAFLMGLSTVITWFSGILFTRIADDESGKKKRIIMVICICINLGILAIYKYGNFGIEIVNAILCKMGCLVIDKRFNFLLPVGISFYTFQALGYMIDVYRGDVEVEKNFFRYTLFVSFFPQLVAGPIERTKNLLSQMQNIENIKIWNAKRITSGAILMVWGLFMKMVIADRVSILVDMIFDNYRMYGSTELILAALGFTLQIYCDFGSYSMVAMGVARILGFNLMENFNCPYFATSIRDFWARWHISLSSWFRDYLYIPLGGNRKGKARKYFNTMFVFLTSGLWHGADLSFMVWGGIHGFYQVMGDFLKPYRERAERKLCIRTQCFSWRLLKRVITFGMVVFAWIFFRADSILDAMRYIKRIIVKPTPWVLFNGEIFNLGLERPEMNILIVSVVILFLVDLVRMKKEMMLDAFLFSQNIYFEWLVIIVMIMMIFTFGEYGPTFDAKQFIYFQF